MAASCRVEVKTIRTTTTRQYSLAQKSRDPTFLTKKTTNSYLINEKDILKPGFLPVLPSMEIEIPN